MYSRVCTGRTLPGSVCPGTGANGLAPERASPPNPRTSHASALTARLGACLAAGWIILGACDLRATAGSAASGLEATVQGDGGRFFYCDAQKGNDQEEGSSWANAWRSLRHATGRVRPGDTVYLRGVFHEPLRPWKSGKPSRPVRFVGPAIIDTRGMHVAVELRKVSWQQVEDLTFRTMSPELPDEIRRRPLQVALLVKGASHNVFKRCAFINAGLGTGKAVVAIMLESNENVFWDSLAISESMGEESFGRRGWLIFASSGNRLIRCSNYGPNAPGPEGDTSNGIGVGVTIYGGRNEDGRPLPCQANRVIGHRSFGTFGYAFGITAGFSWCVDNKFIDCVGYVSPKAYAAAYANAFLTRRGARPQLCQGNGWERCVVVGGQRGFWVQGMAGAEAKDCIAIGTNRRMQSGFELTVQPAERNRYGSFRLIAPQVLGAARPITGPVDLAGPAQGASSQPARTELPGP